MAAFRQIKATLKPILEDMSPDWDISRAWALWGGVVPGMEAVGPLLSFLSSGGRSMWRAVHILGEVSCALMERGPEGPNSCRELVRQFMWRLNEDSGNLGWGSVEALGEILARNPELAASHGRILLSYLRDTGHADNYLDHGPLRQGAYWAAARLAAANAAFREETWPLLEQGLHDEYTPCRLIAAWGIGKLTVSASFTERGSLSKYREILTNMQEVHGSCLLLDGARLIEQDAGLFIRDALAALAAAERREGASQEKPEQA